MQRRMFIAGGAALAAGVALTEPGNAQPITPDAPVHRRKGRLKQGLWKINWGQGSKVPFEEMCAVAARLGAYGFDVIPSQDWPTLRRHGLDPLMVGPGKTDYLGGLIHPEIHAQTLAAISAQADLCAANNVHIIGLSAGQRRGMDYATAADNAVAICQRLAPKLAATGVTLAIENVNDRRGADADLARQDMVFGHWDWGVEVVERRRADAQGDRCASGAELSHDRPDHRQPRLPGLRLPRMATHARHRPGARHRRMHGDHGCLRLIGSFHHANQCESALYSSHGGLLPAWRRGEHFFGRRCRGAVERGKPHSQHDLQAIASGTGAGASESVEWLRRYVYLRGR